MTPRDRAISLLNERQAFPSGSLDWEYRTRAAWNLDQLNRGIPACDWTPKPKQGIDQ